MIEFAANPREEMHQLLRELAGRLCIAGDSKKTIFVRLARFFGWTPTRAEDLYRREARPSVEEMDAARKAALAARQEAKQKDRDDERLAVLEARLSRLEVLLRTQDPDEVGADLHGVRSALRALRRASETED